MFIENLLQEVYHEPIYSILVKTVLRFLYIQASYNIKIYFCDDREGEPYVGYT